ncbi:hypothetical protein SAMN04487943_103298 [Gracilibacillus orientalis]|uniref:DUF4064 domain-containing protein n=1 Tax=Gracilibacillus orientalis TaxID=334253 RepID=A0A1I4K212_9BACI|nr:hypothetical protein [Gracilibacillus orientalis]SFL72583.1 hypothetical protein SAMN04487943_103298 [Gracilibacillus orientalis]
MKVIIRIGGLLGILISLTAMLFAFVDDSYTLGNFGILAIIGSVMGIIGSFKIENKGNIDGFLIIIGIILGVYGLWVFYIIPAALMLVPYLWVLLPKLKNQRTTT